LEPAPVKPPPGLLLVGVEEAEVRVEKLVAGGEGLARLDGVPLFIPRSAPGDRLRVQIVERRPDYGRAEIVEILEPGPGRRPDPYPELSPSGACDLQHLRDDLQPVLKAEAVRETLERLGGIRLPQPVEVVTGEPWGYRLRTQLHTEVDPVTGGARVGYHARGSNDVVPLTQCALLVPALDELLATLPGRLGRQPPRRIDLAAGDDGTVTTAPVVEGLPHGDVSITVGDFSYGFDARCFFQSHRGLLEKLVARTVGDWEGEQAFDLYGGVGLFSLPLARRYGEVVAVESDANAARHARNNARRNKVANLEVVAQVVESWIPRLPSKPDRVVVDPPRGGLSAKIRRGITEKMPRRLTYVSCHPATLARDLRQFILAYEIESVVLFDLFPQTGHMETVVQMVARTET
jgi:23S rRNA (uracil1939-C5)-methyltransferase